MPTIDTLKEQEAPPTPLFLFDCALSSGTTERWATHAVTVDGDAYGARLLKHNLFQLRASSDDGLDGTATISVTLANADSRFSQIERETGFKGAQVTIQFLFYDLVANAAASEARVVFRGVANPADEITESAFRVSFNNRLSLQRIVLPEVQILRRCPWMFPSTLAQRQEALDGGVKGKYSALYKCGYSADITGGAGTLDAAHGHAPFTSCDFTRPACIQRGMFDVDASSLVTRRFGGLEFVPPQISVRSFGESGSHVSAVQDNLAVYNDYVPLVYGTAWYQPPIVFARNDGNLTRMEVLLGMGEVERAIKVIVNDIEIPEAQSGADMTATGWFSVVTAGARDGAFDANFADGSGNPLGDPYGNMAMMSVVVPNRISNGQSLAKIRVLIDGLKLEQFDESGVTRGESFTNNPAWVLLDVLRRSGWLTSEVDLASFASAAAYCGAAITTTDLNGNSVATPRFECNLVLQDRRSAAEVAKGIRAGSTLMLTYSSEGLLALRVENTLALQQASLPDGSNSTATLDGGWPAYEFSDGSATFSGLVRKANGDPAIRLWSQSTAAAPNRLTVEFQDEFNEYQQDSLALVDVDDALLTDRQVTAAYAALGLPNFDQATRVLQLQLNKSIDGYTLIDFETTVKGVGLSPGDLITVTYLKEGLERQPFRITRLSPGENFQTLMVTAQWHDDAWYTSGGALGAGTRRQPGSGVGLPRPLVGSVLDAHGIEQFGITESTSESTDGSFTVTLSTEFVPPVHGSASSVGIPLLSLNAAVNTTGGTIKAAQTLYYAISAVDGSGAETALSFIVPATIPSGPNTNAVTLSGLSFSSGTASFHVYRGMNPVELLSIASGVAVATSYTDAGATATLLGPPDENYYHANFYWRMELQPEVGVNVHSATTIGNSTLGMLTNDFMGAIVRITRGKGVAQERAVLGNTATMLTVSPAWAVEPDTTSFFVVANATWNFGGSSATSPVSVNVPNQTESTVEILGRSANVMNQESAPELNPLTRWQIGGAAGGGVDADVPAAPVFGLNLAGQGTVDLVGISFTDLTNTHTISAGTLALHYWDELSSPSTFSLASGVSSTATTIMLGAAGPAIVDDLIQIEGEILFVTGTLSGGTQYQVTRGSHGSTAATHASTSLIYHLKRNIMIVPFVGDFFGSPASGSYASSIFLPHARIAAADFFVTNVRGNSPDSTASFGATTDLGLRTLSSGQFSIQVEGYLATQTGAAPPLVIDTAHAVRDISAVLNEAPRQPTGSSPGTNTLQLQLRVGSTVYCTLNFDDGSTTSNAAVNGFGLAPLVAGSQLVLDVISVHGEPDSLPGRDLTVTVRL
jgi:Putative phage tail protein